MVGTQRPKSRPAIVDATKPVKTPVTALEEAGLAALLAAAADGCATAAAAVDCAALVTVTNVVAAAPQLTATGVADTGATSIETALTTSRVDAATFLPAASSAVKLEKPLATKTSATERPTAFKGVIFELLDKALAISEPTTPGSMRGVMPRRGKDVGSVGSLQMDGISTTKLLKFCSAATRPIAASSAPLPSSERIRSACVSYQGISGVNHN
jgi:hypothetical protein